MLESWVRPHARRLVALALVAVMWLLMPRPAASERERATLAHRFHFTRAALPELPGPEVRHLRPVHPDLAAIDGWISSVGAAVALADLDGNGLDDDVCYIDTRTDQVIVAPVPGTGARFAPAALLAEGFDRRTMAPMGCLPGDFDEDGALDLLVYYWGRPPELFLRRGTDWEPRPLAPGGGRWFSNAATQADLDGDGHVDLVIANYFPDGARILDAHAGDAASMQRSMSRAFNGGDKHLFRWVGPARFAEVSDALPPEARTSWTLATGAQDLDGDLLPELYLANDFGPDRLLHNRSQPGAPRFELVEGRSGFTVPPSKVLGRDSFKGMGVDFGDVNGDGIPDLFVSNIAAELALEESHFLFVSTGARFGDGVAPYVDESEARGVSRSSWGWDTRFADLDNDGALELLQATGFLRGRVDRWPELQELAMGNDVLLEHPASWPRFGLGDDLCGHTRNPFYVRDGARYVDVAREVGFGENAPSRGIAVADVDGDGDLDIAVANQWEPSTFYRNDCAGCGESLGLRLVIPIEPGTLRERVGAAPLPGRPAIGASARVIRADGTVLVGQVDGGSGHSGKRSPELHFGLGRANAGRPATVELRWREPGGTLATARLRLAPGRHTIALGWTSGGR